MNKTIIVKGVIQPVLMTVGWCTITVKVANYVDKKIKEKSSKKNRRVR